VRGDLGGFWGYPGKASVKDTGFHTSNSDRAFWGMCPVLGGVCTEGDFSRILGGGVFRGILKIGICKGGHFKG
jgi:hypothetical protein